MSVPLQKTQVLGIVVGSADPPAFLTKQLSTINVSPLPAALLSLTRWLIEYYPSSIGAASQLLLPPSLSEKHITSTRPPKAKAPNTSKLPQLTTEQKKVIEQISHSGTYLLHGKTGSGKTRVYLELALKALGQEKSTIILTPEIGLTSQLAKSFQEVFSTRVIVIHSSLTAMERQKQWLRILGSEGPLVVIGPRSALFAPLSKVGLIVLDEAHESAYKQEQSPHYHATRVAARLADLHNSQLVLGSATPSVVDYYLAEHKDRPILRLKELPLGNSSTDVKIIDMKDRSLFDRAKHLSIPLINAIETAVNNKQQVMLYLNRRGTARIVLCDNCGWQALCPRCNLPLTYHGDVHQMQCHVCGFHQPVASACPVCHHPTLAYRAVGTKAVADEVNKLFPHAHIRRFDTDNAKIDRLEQHYSALRSGEIDILIGTQLIAKGLDLPKLSTVGVVLADTSLYLPDFTAHERTYQLLRQVSGRVGRGHSRGIAIIQTYQPGHKVFQAALDDNWRSFYGSELAEREQFFFPPFCYLLKLTCRRASTSAAEKAANMLKRALEEQDLKIKIDGPAPAFHEKVNGKFQWQIVVKATKRSNLLTVISSLPSSGWSYDIDPINLL